MERGFETLRGGFGSRSRPEIILLPPAPTVPLGVECGELLGSFLRSAGFVWGGCWVAGVAVGCLLRGEGAGERSVENVLWVAFITEEHSIGDGCSDNNNTVINVIALGTILLQR